MGYTYRGSVYCTQNIFEKKYFKKSVSKNIYRYSVFISIYQYIFVIYL